MFRRTSCPSLTSITARRNVDGSQDRDGHRRSARNVSPTSTLTNVMQNEIAQCPECGAELEVASLEPLTLALAPQEEEDWGE